MTSETPLQTTSSKLKKALIWLSETLHDHPEKTRQTVLCEAQLRFDLTPAECAFLDKELKSP